MSVLGLHLLHMHEGRDTEQMHSNVHTEKESSTFFACAYTQSTSKANNV